MRKVTKQILYRVRTLMPGDIFGHEEFIQHDDPQNPEIKREYRVTSLLHSEIIYMKKYEFLTCKY